MMTAKIPQAGDPAPDFDLTDLDGRRTGLSDALTGGQSLLLVFLRHLG